MIRNKVTLIVGAGGSAPYGFPLGRSLMIDVIEQLQRETSSGNAHLLHLLMQMGFSQKMQREFSYELYAAKQPSIDAFLQERGDEFLQLGKSAMAAALIPYEYLPDLLAMDHELKNP